MLFLLLYVVKNSADRVLGVREISGSVAHRLSGFEEQNEIVPSRPDVMVTGDRDEAFRGGIGRLAELPFESVRGGVVAGGVRAHVPPSDRAL